MRVRNKEQEGQRINFSQLAEEKMEEEVHWRRNWKSRKNSDSMKTEASKAKEIAAEEEDRTATN